MDAYSPPSGRSTQQQLLRDVEVVGRSPVLAALLQSLSGLLAVLNEAREVLSVNSQLLESCGITDAGRVLGLRPGEVLRCVHADKKPDGCGFSNYCPSCGAALAIVASLGLNKPVERVCAVRARRGNSEVDLTFNVRSIPLEIEGGRYLLLFMQDISDQARWTAMERAFFHDISNILTSLGGATELLAIDNDHQGLAEAANQLLLRLRREIEIQRVLAESNTELYRYNRHPIDLGDFLAEIELLFSNHPAAAGKELELPASAPSTVVLSDYSLLLRILTNMLINAFEASDEGHTVRMWITRDRSGTSFCVWNERAIPPEIQRRVFQRHFSTKGGAGRGIGTYSMKLLAEEYLQGRIDFESSTDKGTVFRLTIP